MNPSLVRRVTIPHFRFKGQDGLRVLDDLEQSQWLSPDRLADLQWQRIGDLLAHAATHVPYYRQAMRDQGLTPDGIVDERSLARMPILERKTVRQEGQRLLAENIPSKRLQRNRTGGSTGEPLHFFNDTQEAGHVYAAFWRSERWCGARIGERQAYLWGADFDLAPYQSLMGRLKTWASNYLMLPAWELSRDNATELWHKLVRFRPGLLIGYAGALYEWSRLLSAERMGAECMGAERTRYQQHPVPELKGIIASAETLFPHWRQAIEQTFGVPVYNRYAGRDTKFVAQECSEHSGLHVAAENCYLEIVRDDQPAKPGELGEIVVTLLHNWAMPFIRYRTGDLGVQGEGLCSCNRGLPMLASVDGRVQDVLRTAGGKLISGLLFAHLMKDCPEVKEFQVHQTALDELIILLVTDPPKSLPSRGRIERVIREYFGPDMRTIFEFRGQISLGDTATSSGKRRISISHLDHSF
jgi:phenylacetate-CoA ligase